MTDRSAANGTTAAPGRKQQTAPAAVVAPILSSVARPRARTWPRKQRQGASLYGPRPQSYRRPDHRRVFQHLRPERGERRCLAALNRPRGLLLLSISHIRSPKKTRLVVPCGAEGRRPLLHIRAPLLCGGHTTARAGATSCTAVTHTDGRPPQICSDEKTQL